MNLLLTAMAVVVACTLLVACVYAAGAGLLRLWDGLIGREVF